MRISSLLVAIGIALPSLGPREAAAQEIDSDSLATEFQTAIRAMAWAPAAARMHPEGLDHFKYLITVLIEAEGAGSRVLDLLFPGMTVTAYHAHPPERVFQRVLGFLTERARGLMHALVVREVEVLGSVFEGPELAHVVYRSEAQLSGAVPELRVMTLKRDGGAWRVLTSQELDVVIEAFKGETRRSGSPPSLELRDTTRWTVTPSRRGPPGSRR